MSDELTCPACRKVNDWDSDQPCVRCEADLNTLRTIQVAAVREQSRAREALRHQDWRAAAEHAARSWNLVQSPESARLGFLAALADSSAGEPSLWLARTGGN
ncbi:MAG: hypothetical protein ISQ14_02355 [Verrucomicrobiae bacterium]|nr:hypothetical protein [Verrucomicrobiae bacterium]